MESGITYCEIPGVVETKKVYNKRKKPTSDTNGINKHFADACEEATIRKADETVDDDNVKTWRWREASPKNSWFTLKHNYLW